MKIYLAIPYTGMESKSFKFSCQVAGELMKKGNIVYAPISHSHPIAVQCNLPKTWDYWKDVDEAFIGWCDELWVVMLDGFKESKGVNAEIEIALRLNKKIRFIPKNA